MLTVKNSRKPDLAPSLPRRVFRLRPNHPCPTLAQARSIYCPITPFMLRRLEQGKVSFSSGQISSSGDMTVTAREFLSEFLPIELTLGVHDQER